MSRNKSSFLKRTNYKLLKQFFYLTVIDFVIIWKISKIICFKEGWDLIQQTFYQKTLIIHWIPKVKQQAQIANKKM